ncbi:MAG: TonB family protein [Calditrichaceae bacterium]|nr:TonB family protein [Calditrichaceae bacterium]MBN2707534.1 TonB family protein [Calditrichaceae bacterium]RQV95623.1 MAG: TonB family protein [Calditrichota bacterium]
MPNAQKDKRPAGPGGYRIVAFPKEFEKNIWEDIDRRFYAFLLSSLVIIYGIVIYLGSMEYSQEAVDEQIKKRYLQKFYEAEFVEEVTPTEEEGEGGIGEDEEKPKVDERAQRDEGRRAEATGPSAAERRAQRRAAAAARGAARAAMAQAVAGTGVLAELSAGGGGGTGDAVYDVLGETGGGGIGDLDAVLSGVGGLQTASSSARRSQLGARSTGGGAGGPVGIDNLIDGGVGASGSVSIKRRGGFSLKMEQGSVSGKGSRSTARSADAISQVVNKHADAVENCYKKEARINPNLKGSIQIQFTIDPDGKVSQVRITDSTLRNRNVENCITKTVNRWRFQRIDKKEGDATFRQKFIFTS